MNYKIVSASLIVSFIAASAHENIQASDFDYIPPQLGPAYAEAIGSDENRNAWIELYASTGYDDIEAMLQSSDAGMRVLGIVLASDMGHLELLYDHASLLDDHAVSTIPRIDVLQYQLDRGVHADRALDIEIYPVEWPVVSNEMANAITLWYRVPQLKLRDGGHKLFQQYFLEQDPYNYLFPWVHMLEKEWQRLGRKGPAYVLDDNGNVVDYKSIDNAKMIAIKERINGLREELRWAVIAAAHEQGFYTHCEMAEMYINLSASLKRMLQIRKNTLPHEPAFQNAGEKQVQRYMQTIQKYDKSQSKANHISTHLQR